MFGDQVTIPQATLVALFSITVVFLVLLSISYLIKIVAGIVNRNQKPKQQEVAKAAPVQEAPAEEEPEDDSHLVAVITAAVASYLGKDAGSFVVKSITPLNTESDWSRLSRTRALH